MNGFHQALGRAVASKAGVYGFPLIIWSSGGLQVHRFGMPGMVRRTGVRRRGSRLYGCRSGHFL